MSLPDPAEVKISIGRSRRPREIQIVCEGVRASFAPAALEPNADSGQRFAGQIAITQIAAFHRAGKHEKWWRNHLYLVYHAMVARRQPPKAPAGLVPAVLHDEGALQQALAELQALDPAIIAPIVENCGMPPLRRREASFEGLVSIIISQQVSTASADAIFARTRARFEPFEPAALIAATDLDLRQCGLSTTKVKTLRALAQAIAAGLDLSALALISAADAHASLIAIKGIGPWTADIFLMFCVGHTDIWPAGDLALQEAVKLALALDTRPAAQELVVIAERWRPYRAVAARLLWAYYRLAKEEARGKPRASLDLSAKTGNLRRSML
jgi:DNA-3-methyladenine glycosylase II